jgi:hypothetical protein
MGRFSWATRSCKDVQPSTMRWLEATEPEMPTARSSLFLFIEALTLLGAFPFGEGSDGGFFHLFGLQVRCDGWSHSGTENTRFFFTD